MNIQSARFIKSVVAKDKTLEDGKPQIAFIGRSNVGKSSTINAILNRKDLSRVSSAPGRTTEINLFLINENFYLVDLPGYGYAKKSREKKEELHELINWYLFEQNYKHKRIVLIIDAFTGPSGDDIDLLEAMEEEKLPVLIIANKIDKIKPSVRKHHLKELEEMFPGEKIIYYSTKDKTGLDNLRKEIFSVL
jgi:GTP-binding protein